MEHFICFWNSRDSDRSTTATSLDSAILSSCVLCAILTERARITSQWVVLLLLSLIHSGMDLSPSWLFVSEWSSNWDTRSPSVWQHFCDLLASTRQSQIYTMTAARLEPRVLLLFCFVSSAACNTFAFTEEPFERAGKADGYCSRILRAQGNRKESNSEFRLRVEGDPDSYQPGSTYRGLCLSERRYCVDCHFERIKTSEKETWNKFLHIFFLNAIQETPVPG